MPTIDSNSLIYILSLVYCPKRERDILCIVPQKGYNKARRIQRRLKWMIPSVD